MLTLELGLLLQSHPQHWKRASVMTSGERRTALNLLSWCVNENNIKPQDRVRFKLLLSWKLWRDSKHKACKCQGVVCLCFCLMKLFFIMELCTPHHAVIGWTTALVVIRTALREGQDVAVTHTFGHVDLNISIFCFSGKKECEQVLFTMPSFESRYLLLALAAHHRYSMGGTEAALFCNSRQVFLAPRSCMLPTKHLA